MVLHVFHDFTAAEHWTDFVEFSLWYETARCVTNASLLTFLGKRFTEELPRRQLCYGIDDARTTSLELLGNAAAPISFLVPGMQQGGVPGYFSDVDDTGNNVLNGGDISASGAVETSRHSSVPPGPEAIARQISQISGLPGRISALQCATVLFRVPWWMRWATIRVDPSEMLFNALLSAAHKLPVLVVILTCQFAWILKSADRARRLCAIAVDRTRGLGNF